MLTSLWKTFQKANPRLLAQLSFAGLLAAVLGKLRNVLRHG